MKSHENLTHPLPITMWDFSWLERRWPGAGYEDWNQILDELMERGYEAVRIDAYPHLTALGTTDSYEVKPVWHFCDWGSPIVTDVAPLPALIEFVGLCREKGVRVLLSSWFRKDTTGHYRNIPTPEAHAEIWAKTLRILDREGLLPTLLGVDLCNEFPGHLWAPFYSDDPNTWHGSTPECQDWTRRAVAPLQAEFPNLGFTFSFNQDPGSDLDFTHLDFFEPHIWVSQAVDINRLMGLTHIDNFVIDEMEQLGRQSRSLYSAHRAAWEAVQDRQIEAFAACSRRWGKALMTTECWATVNYRDWPRFDWGWVKELTGRGTLAASKTGCWSAIATSNFCGPQFQGMWRDIDWHQRHTSAIRAGVLPLLVEA